MSGLNNRIIDAVKQFTQDDRNMQDFLIKLLILEFDNQVPLEKRKDYILELTDNYR